MSDGEEAARLAWPERPSKDQAEALPVSDQRLCRCLTGKKRPDSRGLKDQDQDQAEALPVSNQRLCRCPTGKKRPDSRGLKNLSEALPVSEGEGKKSTSDAATKGEGN